MNSVQSKLSLILNLKVEPHLQAPPCCWCSCAAFVLQILRLHPFVCGWAWFVSVCNHSLLSQKKKSQEKKLDHFQTPLLCILLLIIILESGPAETRKHPTLMEEEAASPHSPLFLNAENLIADQSRCRGVPMPRHRLVLYPGGWVHLMTREGKLCNTGISLKLEHLICCRTTERKIKCWNSPQKK